MIRLQYLLAILLTFCLLWAAPGQAAARKKPPLTVKLLYSSSYDSNILEYSAQDIDRFEHNQEPYTPPITTADDWINSVGLRLYRDFNLGHRLHFRPYYQGRVSLYAINEVKNSQSHNFQARFSYRSLAYLTLKYFYLPDYFLRVYYDRDTRNYHGADFTLSRPAVALRLEHDPYQLEIEGGREYDYYNPYFTEWDIQANYLGATATWDGLPNLDLSLGYTYKKADNIGFNQALQTVQDPSLNTEYGDGSYGEDQYSLGVDYQLPRIKRTIYWKAEFNWQRNYRYYFSTQSLTLDPFHTGRRDRRDTFETAVTLSPSSDLDFVLSFTYDMRRSTSPNPDVSAVKNYDNRALEFTLVYQVF